MVNLFSEIILWIMFGTMVAGCIYILIPAIITDFLKKKYRFKCSQQAEMHFTFDDGPDRQATIQIASILEGHGKRGVFFAVGSRVEKHKDIIKELLHRGHKVGLHGYDHLHPWRSSPLAMWKDLRMEDRLFESILGKRNSKLYRPPFGKFNIVSLLYCIWKKREICFWTIDPRDYQKSCPEEIIAAIQSQKNNVGVILFHDGRYGTSSGDAINTVTAVSRYLNDKKASIRVENDKVKEVQDIPIISLNIAEMALNSFPVSGFLIRKKRLQKKTV